MGGNHQEQVENLESIIQVIQDNFVLVVDISGDGTNRRLPVAAAGVLHPVLFRYSGGEVGCRLNPLGTLNRAKIRTQEQTGHRAGFRHHR
jgi:hypothetical protein